MKLKSQFFSELGIHPPFLRVISCNWRPENNVFQVVVHFKGMTEKELTLIQLWIRSSNVAKGAA
ncbi:MAG: hypothetical protein ACXWC9_01920 [Pseudobdellovibrionaceae bacterium]